MMEKSAEPFVALVSRARSGDPVAQDELFAHHRAWLRGMAQRALCFSKKDDASDLAQESLLAASQRLHQFRGNDPGTFRRWLQGIQRNLIGRFFRSQVARTAQLVHLDHDVPRDGLDDTSPVLAEVCRREDVALLIEAIGELDEQERLLIQLKFFSPGSARLTYDEISQQMGVSSAALRQRMCRLLKRLAVGIRLLRALKQYQLDERSRAVLLARYLRGRSAAQIAEQLGCSPRSAAELIRRAESELPRDWDREE